MTTSTDNARKTYVYTGLAGETAPGRPVMSGLYRMAVGDDQWQLLSNGLPEGVAIRAITVHPQKPEIVFVGTQFGPFLTGQSLTVRTRGFRPCGRNFLLPSQRLTICSRFLCYGVLEDRLTCG